MRSTFFGIETQRRALLTHRRVMDTIGHNVANAATPGYSRQIVNLGSTNPFPYPGVNRLYGAGQIGTGVITESIERVRDFFVDGQVRKGTTNLAQLDIEKSTLRQIENAFLEPSSARGFNGAMTDFYDAWQELSQFPESAAARNQVLAMGRNITDVVNNIDQVLRQVRVDLNGQLKKDVDIVNTTLENIASLSPEIAKVYTHGDTPNDLLDKRDILLDELAQYLDYDVIDSEYLGGIAISVSGRELLRNQHVFELSYNPAWDHPSQNSQTPYMNDVSQADYTMLSQYSKGELKGIINSRDVIIPEVQRQFTEMVSSLVHTVNNTHSQGLGVQVEDYSTFGGGTTAAITHNANYAQILGTDTQYFSTGDLIQIVDATNPSSTVTVEITDVQTDAAGNGRLYFDNIGPLMKTSETAPGTYTDAAYTIASGAEIRKIVVEKYNFFDTADLLGKHYIGDTTPEYSVQMTSSIRLPDSITMQTTIKELEQILGVQIDPSGGTSGERLMLDNNAYTKLIDDNMTLDEVFSRISSIRPMSNDGEPLEIRFDEINRNVILRGDTYNALSELGGESGSVCNLFRVLGFEGFALTGFELQSGTELNTTLSDLGISDGWIQIDNTLIQVDNSVNLQSALDDINAALNNSPSSKSYNTNIFYDAAAGRVRVVSDHNFSVDTPEASIFPGTPPNAASNMLTVIGLQQTDTNPTYAKEQSLVSTTTSDIGARLRINESLAANIDRLATASTYAGIPGDNSIALDLAALKNTFLLGDSSTGRVESPKVTIDDYYNNMIAEVGVESQSTIMNAEAADKFLEYYQNRKAEVSGVSIDEEMTKLIEVQYAYQAAARMINVVDGMLDRIINGMGLVGR